MVFSSLSFTAISEIVHSDFLGDSGSLATELMAEILRVGCPAGGGSRKSRAVDLIRLRGMAERLHAALATCKEAEGLKRQHSKIYLLAGSQDAAAVHSQAAI